MLASNNLIDKSMPSSCSSGLASCRVFSLRIPFWNSYGIKRYSASPIELLNYHDIRKSDRSLGPQKHIKFFFAGLSSTQSIMVQRQNVTSRVLSGTDHGAKLFTVCRAQPAEEVSCDWISGSVGSKVLIQRFSWSIMYTTIERDSIMDRVQLILSLDLLLRLPIAANHCYQVIACIAWRRLQTSPIA